MSRWISFLVLAAIIGVFGFLFWQVMSQFLLPLFMAVVLVVIFRPLHQWFLKTLNGRRRVAAFCSTFCILVVVLLPFALILSLAAAEAVGLGSRLAREDTLYDLERKRNEWGLWLPPEDALVVHNDIKSAMTDLERSVRRIADGQPPGRNSPLSLLEKIHPWMDTLLDELSAVKRNEVAHGLWDPPNAEWVKNRVEATKMLEQMLRDTRHLEQELAQNAQRRDDAAKSETSGPRETPPVRPDVPQPPNPSILPGGDARVIPAETTETTGPEPPASEQTTSDNEPAADNEPTAAASPDLKALAGLTEGEAPPAPADAAEGEPEEPPKAEPEGELSEDQVTQLQDLLKTYDEFSNKLLGLQASFGFKRVFNPDKATVKDLVTEIQDWLAPVAQGTFAFVGKFVIGLIVMAVSLFFFLSDGDKMVATVMALSPLDDRHEAELLIQFEKISRAVVLATLATAVCQGVLGGLGYWYVGLNSYVLLTLITMVTSMIPFVGAAAVWISCSVYLALIGDWGHAIGLAVWGTVVVSMVDNVVKPYILHGQSNLHPLLALLSVIGGVAAMGPIGIFVGPMAVAFLQALLHILHHELESMDSDGILRTARGDEDWHPGSGSIVVGPYDTNGAAAVELAPLGDVTAPTRGTGFTSVSYAGPPPSSNGARSAKPGKSGQRGRRRRRKRKSGT